MSMGNIRLSPEEMNQKATEFDNRSEEFQTCVTKMRNMVTSLSQEWEGQSSRAFVDQFNELEQGFNKTVELIESIATQLRQVSDAMVDADSQISQQIGGR